MPPAARAARSVADGARFVQNVKNRAEATRFAQNVRTPVPGGSGETPQQRVARLRDAARRERLNQITTFDKVVHYGRIWADNLHRATVFTIMGFSAVTIGITLYSVYGMTTYSRANKKEYLAEIMKERSRQYEEWRRSEINEVVKTGISEEAAGKMFDDAEEARRQSETIWGRLKTWAVGGLTPAEETYNSRYELQEDRIAKQVFNRLQKEFYEKRGMELPKKEEDDEEEDNLAMAAASGIAAASGTAPVMAPEITGQSGTEALSNLAGETKEKSKGYWGTIRSWLTDGRM